MIRIITELGKKAVTTITMRSRDGIEVAKEHVSFDPGIEGCVLDKIQLGDSVQLYLTRKQAEELFADMAKTCAGIEEEVSDAEIE